GKFFSVISIITLCFIFNYHAYGILVVLLPMFYFLNFTNYRMNDSYLGNMLKVVFISLPIWCWYAFGNSFGMTPNKLQAVVDTFQFLPAHKAFSITLAQLFGDNLVIQFLMPLVFIALLSSTRKATWLTLLFMIILPIILILIMDIKTHYCFIQRQWVFVIPWFALWCGGLIDGLCQKIKSIEVY
ncbi:MAG: hypothetical protein AABY22_07890, partial [Nanoarchaeota archaeon]